MRFVTFTCGMSIPPPPPVVCPPPPPEVKDILRTWTLKLPTKKESSPTFAWLAAPRWFFPLLFSGTFEGLTLDAELRTKIKHASCVVFLTLTSRSRLVEGLGSYRTWDGCGSKKWNPQMAPKGFLEPRTKPCGWP